MITWVSAYLDQRCVCSWRLYSIRWASRSTLKLPRQSDRRLPLPLWRVSASRCGAPPMNLPRRLKCRARAIFWWTVLQPTRSIPTDYGFGQWRITFTWAPRMLLNSPPACANRRGREDWSADYTDGTDQKRRAKCGIRNSKLGAFRHSRWAIGTSSPLPTAYCLLPTVLSFLRLPRGGARGSIAPVPQDHG